MGYIPDGMTQKQWDTLKRKEAEKKKKKNFGASGAKGFKSRSMASFQAALERGEAAHLMPVDPKKVKSGEIPLKDVPYMQRGGSWDNSDIAGKGSKKGWMRAGTGKMTAFNDGKAKKMKENEYDKKYNGRKESKSIFNWTGKRED